MAQLQAKAAGGSELTRGEQADIVAPRVDVNSLVDLLRARQTSGAWAWRVLAMHHRRRPTGATTAVAAATAATGRRRRAGLDSVPGDQPLGHLGKLRGAGLW